MLKRISILVLLAGCGQNSAPPDWDGVISGYGMDVSLIATTTVSPLNATDEVELSIVGLPGAAPSPGIMEAENLRSSERTEEYVEVDGSFLLQIGALLDDEIHLSFDGPLGTDEYALDATAHTPFPTLAPNGLTVSSPDEHGQVLVQIALEQPVANARFYATNHDNHAAVELTRLSATEAAGNVDADHGHRIVIHATLDGAATEAHSLTVP